MSNIKPQDKLDKKYEEYDEFESPHQQKYSKPKFKKKTLTKRNKKLNKQSDYRKRARRKR